jgi:hypothetical protein
MVADIVERLSGQKVARQIFGGLSKHSQGGSHFEVEALGEIYPARVFTAQFTLTTS